MDPILFILGVIGFIVISVISNIAEKKKQREQEEQARRTGQPSGAPPQAGPRPSIQDWQEQLRRMLNQENGPQAPPVIHMPPPEPRPQRAQPPPVKRTHTPTPPPIRTTSMAPSPSLYEKARELQKKVARRVEIIEQQKTEIVKEVRSDIPSRPGPKVRRKAPAPKPVQVRRAIELVRNHATVRDAFVASIILGPPKALEEKT